MNESDLNILVVIKLLWSKRTFLIKAGAIGLVLGGLLALDSQKQYSVKTSMIPQLSTPVGGSKLGGLASLAGISIGGPSAGNDIPPKIYPDIINSVPFRKKLLETEITTSREPKSITYLEYQRKYEFIPVSYWVKEYTIGLPKVIYKKLIKKKPQSLDLSQISGSSSSSKENGKKEAIVVLTPEEYLRTLQLINQLTLRVDDVTGIVSITARMPEALAAAQLAESAQELLKEAITELKVVKAREELDFTQELYNEKREEFENAQEALGKFRDRNRDISSSIALNEEERLQTDYDLAYTVFTEVAKELATARIEVEKDTPAFTILDPVVVPIKADKSKAALLVVGFIVLAMAIASGWLFLKTYIGRIKGDWKSTEV